MALARPYDIADTPIEQDAAKFVADLHVLASDWRADREKAARADEIAELERKLKEARESQAQRLKSVDEQCIARVVEAARLRARHAERPEFIYKAMEGMVLELRRGWMDPDNARRTIVNAEHERQVAEASEKPRRYFIG